MDEEARKESYRLIFCPLMPKRVCSQATFGDTDEFPCAWWIPGAECCAIVQIARKLSDLAVVQTISVNYRLPREDRIPF